MTDINDERDYAEEQYNRNLCPRCNYSPCITGDGHCEDNEQDPRIVNTATGETLGQVRPGYSVGENKLARTVRVALQMTVEVEVDTWAEEYGIEATAAAVRQDVKAYIGNAVQSMPVTPTDVTWK